MLHARSRGARRNSDWYYTSPSVGRARGAEESAEEGEGQPKRKRARRTKAEKGGGDDGMEVDEEGRKTGAGRRGSSSASWTDAGTFFDFARPLVT